MKALLNLRFPRKQALSTALLFAFLVGQFSPFVAHADGPAIGEAFNFTSIGTTSWTVPAGVSSVKVKVWGGGGAGGTGEKINETHRSGLGGGAGGYSEKTIVVNPGDSFSITIGTGGQGYMSYQDGRVGYPGTESRFEGGGHALIAEGGKGGASFTGGGNPTEPIGLGGNASGGDINTPGESGGGYSVDGDGNPYASNGGSAANGGQGGSRGRCGADGGCNGSAPGSPWAQNGASPGGGGGGSDVGFGGKGGDGQVLIEVVSVGNQSPVGWLDAVSCDTIVGWAYDPSNPSASIDVHFYTDGTGQSDKLIGSTQANIVRQDVNDAQAITGDHGFLFTVPLELKDGQPHKIYAYAIDLESPSANATLQGVPKEINCSGGGNPTDPNQITAAITTTANTACVAAGTRIPFTITVGGANVTEVIIEKDTNNDGTWGRDSNSPVQTTLWTAPGTYTFHSNETADYTGTYRLRVLVNGEVKDIESVNVAANCGGGNGNNPTPITAALSTTANTSCVAAGTSVVFSINVGGDGINSVVLEKDTDNNGEWGGVGVWNGAIATTYSTNESASYTGTYRLRLLVNGEVKDTETVQFNATCGGGNNGGTNPTPISGAIATSAAACVAAGTNIPFTVTVTGSNISTAVLQKDTNGDADYQQVASYNAAGTYTFASAESTAYTGPYTLRLLVNGTVVATRTVQVSNNCGGTSTTEPITASLSVSAACVAPGTNFTFTATVGGTGINTIRLEKDTNGDGDFGLATEFANTPGTYTFTSNEPADYAGTYAMRLIVNGTVMDTENVTVSSNCGGGTTNPPPGTSGGGGGGGGRSGGPCVGFGCPTTTPPTSTGPGLGDILILIDTPSTGGNSGITGPEQVCASGNTIRTFLKIGLDNDPNEVMKLQRFLNKYESANLAVNGVFDTATEAAVKALQFRYNDRILSPWGVSEPTGIVYLTTTRYINTVSCGDTDLLKDIDSGIINPVNPGDFEGEIGQATSTPADTSNIAGILGALKDIPWYQLLILILLIAGSALIIATAFRRGLTIDEAYMSFIRGAAILAIATVLNVLNTVSYILNPQWFVEKTGVTLPWLLGLDAVNLGAIAVICLSVLIALYERISRMNN